MKEYVVQAKLEWGGHKGRMLRENNWISNKELTYELAEVSLDKRALRIVSYVHLQKKGAWCSG